LVMYSCLDVTVYNLKNEPNSTKVILLCPFKY
jgi:hypothetical protein